MVWRKGLQTHSQYGHGDFFPGPHMVQFWGFGRWAEISKERGREEGEGL